MRIIATIYEVAKVAGVSPSTVSKVLNNYPDVSEKTKEKVKNVLKEMSFMPSYEAQVLSTKKTWTLGVVYLEDANVGLKHPYFSSIIEAFKQEAEKHGYSLLFGSKNDRLKNSTFLQFFKYKSVDGIVIFCSGSKNHETKELIESKYPTVVIDMENKNVSTVTSDNVGGCALVIDYLYNLGHRKIAHIAGMDDNFVSNLRQQAYISEMKKKGLEIKEGYIECSNTFDFNGGYNATKKLLNLKEIPTAIFAAGDEVAIGAIEAIKESGLNVPDDISVVGFDDIHMAKYITPKLTTVRQDCDKIGQVAANRLISQIDRKKKDTLSSTISVELIIRESTKIIE